MKKRVCLSWSGGKDCTLSLFYAQSFRTHRVVSLLTTISETYQRISMHGVRRTLLEQQAQSIGLPLSIISLSEAPTMEAYEAQMRRALLDCQTQGISSMMFGDIFLEDLRVYREKQLASMEMDALFPLWKKPTETLLRDFIALGFKAIVTCVSEQYLDAHFVGRIVDENFMRDLPPHVDICGENGEFHTFVFDGPLFRYPILFEKGKVTYRTYPSPNASEKNPRTYGCWYMDLLPTTSLSADQRDAYDRLSAAGKDW